jgi:hypothetical protein
MLLLVINPKFFEIIEIKRINDKLKEFEKTKELN